MRLACALVVVASLARELPAAPLDAAGIQTLVRYLGDPPRTRRAMTALGHGGTDEWPAAAVLILADAHVRSGQLEDAARLLRGIQADDAPAYLKGWSRLGLAWIAFITGDRDTARHYFDRLTLGNWGSPVGRAGLGLTDAIDGQTREAVARLDILASGAARLPMRCLSRLLSAYARYWGGQHAAAARLFAEVAADYPKSPLVDDARYGAAWARWRSGDRAGGYAALEALSHETGTGVSPPHIPRSLVELEPQEVFRGALKRYRLMPAARPVLLMTALVDGDGAALARAALTHPDVMRTARRR
jgi:hypothetical protein